jgi:hypothetical protein
VVAAHGTLGTMPAYANLGDVVDQTDESNTTGMQVTESPSDAHPDEASRKDDPPTAPSRRSDRRVPNKLGTKSTAKKAAPKKKVSATRAAAASAQLAKFPRHSVERALRIPKAIYEQNGGNPATPTEAVQFTGGSALGGPFKVEISSSKKYGFLESEAGKLRVSARARQAIAPQTENDRLAALREAVLAAPELSEVYNFYRGENLPDRQFLVNALTDRFRLPTDKVAEFLEVFYESIRAAELIDETGERARLIDVGRDEAHRPSAGKAAPKAATGSNNSCFVMQPFAGPLGGYYDLIFKPAIEQAGMKAVRADAEIFGTGKIIDQIWRGIRSATVLIAELTSKNPNVFYELGLAHALEKPVVLVSSNQDDVPFDLRHIRVILYDQSDPFWGDKLIDKVADNIKSAISNPEDAIFRITDLLPE